jgi:sarcosine oxidase subunit gamma
MVNPALRRVPALTAADWLEPAPPALRFAFYGDRAARAAAAAVWGTGFSEDACRACTQGSRAALWMGPDEHLLLDFAPEAAAAAGACPSESAVHAAMAAAIGALPHALVDVSHRQFAFEVRGPHAADILNGACPLDLDIDAFPIGMCTRTVLAKAEIVLWRTREQAFHVEAWRSFAPYVTGLLAEIASEYYPHAR